MGVSAVGMSERGECEFTMYSEYVVYTINYAFTTYFRQTVKISDHSVRGVVRRTAALAASMEERGVLGKCPMAATTWMASDVAVASPTGREACKSSRFQERV